MVEEIQRGPTLRTSCDNSEYEVLCKTQEVPKIINCKNPQFDGIVLLHQSKNELVFSGEREGGVGETLELEVLYGGDVVRVKVPKPPLP